MLSGIKIFMFFFVSDHLKDKFSKFCHAAYVSFVKLREGHDHLWTSGTKLNLENFSYIEASRCEFCTQAAHFPLIPMACFIFRNNA